LLLIIGQIDIIIEEKNHGDLSEFNQEKYLSLDENKSMEKILLRLMSFLAHVSVDVA
jgi:hypothetical protein